MDEIYQNVINAMQDAEEIWGGLSKQEYMVLMNRIAQEAITRALTAAEEMED